MFFLSHNLQNLNKNSNTVKNDGVIKFSVLVVISHFTRFFASSVKGDIKVLINVKEVKNVELR